MFNLADHLSWAVPPLPPSLHRATGEQVYRHGFDAERVDQFGLAAACFEEVRRRQPRNPYVLIDLARVYFLLLENDRAQSVLGAAAELAGSDPDVWYQMGRAYQEGRADLEAERCFLKARTHAGDDILPSAAVVAFYASRGMLPQAQAALREITGRETANGLVTALRGIVALRLGERTAALELLNASLGELPQQHPYQVNVRYALARALADSGQEAASLDVLREAKQRQAALPETQHYRAAHRMVLQFRAAALAALGVAEFRGRWRTEAAPGQQPLVFLLGYPRSGTTLLEQVLEAHGSVHSLDETGALLQATRQMFPQPPAPGQNPWEIIDARDAAGRDLARAWYAEYLRRLGAPRDRSMVVLDKNPGLSGHIQLIGRLFPHARILFLVRDPRDVCLSAYRTQVSLTSFSVNWLDWQDTIRHNIHILEHWIALRDRLPNPYLEVRYEDLIADLPGKGRQIMEFLGLKWRPEQARFADHARGKPLYSPTLYEVRQGLNTGTRGRWRRFALDFSMGEPGLASLLREYGYAGEAGQWPASTTTNLTPRGVTVSEANSPGLFASLPRSPDSNQEAHHHVARNP